MSMSVCVYLKVYCVSVGGLCEYMCVFVSILCICECIV